MGRDSPGVAIYESGEIKDKLKKKSPTYSIGGEK
jgi:hypothetical protein